jgi:hypothetical protein
MRKSDLKRIERHFTLCSREFLEYIAAKSKKPEIRKIAQKILANPPSDSDIEIIKEEEKLRIQNAAKNLAIKRNF